MVGTLYVVWFSRPPAVGWCGSGLGLLGVAPAPLWWGVVHGWCLASSSSSGFGLTWGCLLPRPVVWRGSRFWLTRALMLEKKLRV